MLISANVVLCETVLIEKNDVASAIRIINVITVAPGSHLASFKAHTILNCDTFDFSQHVVQLQVFRRDGAIVGSAPPYNFIFANRVDTTGPGAFNLTTEFTIDMTRLPRFDYYFVAVFVDGNRIGGTPLMLRKGV